jgi:predicted  nucleic acid-binding Zn-ribbon protein
LHCPKCGAVVAQYIKSRCLIHAEKYERLEAAVKEMNTPYHSASDFVHTQSDEVMEKYDRWLEEKEIYEEEGKVIRKVKKLR